MAPLELLAEECRTDADAGFVRTRALCQCEVYVVVLVTRECGAGVGLRVCVRV
jgi:hypothetical protein